MYNIEFTKREAEYKEKPLNQTAKTKNKNRKQAMNQPTNQSTKK